MRLITAAKRGDQSLHFDGWISGPHDAAHDGDADRTARQDFRNDRGINAADGNDWHSRGGGDGRQAGKAEGRPIGPYVRSANSAPRRNRRRYRASGAACPRKAGTKIRSTRQ